MGGRKTYTIRHYLFGSKVRRRSERSKPPRYYFAWGNYLWCSMAPPIEISAGAERTKQICFVIIIEPLKKQCHRGCYKGLQANYRVKVYTDYPIPPENQQHRVWHPSTYWRHREGIGPQRSPRTNSANRNRRPL